MPVPTLTSTLLKAEYLAQIKANHPEALICSNGDATMHRRYLQRHCPTRHALLTEQGLLDLACLAAEARATGELLRLKRLGMDLSQAQELVRRSVLFPPSEAEQKDSGETESRDQAMAEETAAQDLVTALRL